MHREMLPCLGHAAKEIREAAGVRPIQVAVHVERDTKAVLSFEQGRAWPRKLDSFLALYAERVGVEPAEIWKRAMTLYLSDNGRS